MACDLATFKSNFPELDFAATPGSNTDQRTRADALITVKLAQAVAIVDRGSYATTTLADTATLYLAAHLQACSPSGLAAKLIARDFSGSVYGEIYSSLAVAACAGGLVP